jgi:hypothetical protein
MRLPTGENMVTQQRDHATLVTQHAPAAFFRDFQPGGLFNAASVLCAADCPARRKAPV